MAKKIKRVTTDVDAEKWKALRIDCIERGISLHAAIDQMLDWWFQTKENAQS